MIDNRRYLVAWADFHELRRHLRLFSKIDRNDLVCEPRFFKHHARLISVIRHPGVAIDHLNLPKKSLSGAGSIEHRWIMCLHFDGLLLGLCFTPAKDLK